MKHDFKLGWELPFFIRTLQQHILHNVLNCPLELFPTDLRKYYASGINYFINTRHRPYPAFISKVLLVIYSGIEKMI
jgi:hypothetical protein